MKVQIKSCKVNSYWYADCIDENFKVDPNSKFSAAYGEAYCLESNTDHFILCEDFVLVDCEGTKLDSDKPDWSLLPLHVVEYVVKVLTFGAKKYDRENWQLVEPHEQRYYAAVLRHLKAWQQGEKKDPETGLPHLAHAMCCLIFLLWFDDRDGKLK